MTVKIYQKTSIIIALAFVGLIAVLYAASSSLLLANFVQAEEDQALQNARHLANALADDISILDGVAFELASRDDMAAFLSGDHSNPPIDAMDMALYQRLGFNYFLILAADGTPLAGQGFDLKSKAPASVPESLSGAIAGTTQGPAPEVIGLLTIPEGTLLVASRTVADREGTPAGMVVIARDLDRTEIDHLGFVTGLPVEIIPYDYATTVPALSGLFSPDTTESNEFLKRNDEGGISVNAPLVTRAVNSETMAGYSLINDISGNPAIILRATMPRIISEQGEAGMFSFLLIMVGGGVVFGVLMIVLLQKYILSRLSLLSARVQEIGLNKDFAARIPVKGDDEMASLATAINGMLGELEYSQLHLDDRLRESKERYQRLFNSWDDILLVYEVTHDDRPGTFLEVNEAGCDRLGYERREILGMSITSLVPASDVAKFVTSRKAALEDESGKAIFETEYITKDGRHIPMEVNVKFLDYMGTTAVLSAARDITERRDVEELKRQAFVQIEKNMEQFAILNDHIRNPLQAIVGLALMHDENEKLTEEIVSQAAIINRIVDKLDSGWIESEKIRAWLRRYYKFD
ncbi:MAG: PAS domain S-box protein [Methanomicrobiales archaeon]|nr:PAS domain S-box protein [Methanomicrobiales archaeon]